MGGWTRAPKEKQDLEGLDASIRIPSRYQDASLARDVLQASTDSLSVKCQTSQIASGFRPSCTQMAFSCGKERLAVATRTTWDMGLVTRMWPWPCAMPGADASCVLTMKSDLGTGLMVFSLARLHARNTWGALKIYWCPGPAPVNFTRISGEGARC